MATSIALQKSKVNTGLNSGMLLSFLMGCYTVVYFGTLYLYVTRRSSQRLRIVVSLSLMWIFAMGLLATVWFGMNWCIVIEGDTREDISRCNPPNWVFLLQDLVQFPVFIVADGLLIWRCYHVWNRSLLATAVPFSIMVLEAGCFMASIIMLLVHKLVLGTKQGTIYNWIVATAFFLSFTSTTVATLLIGYKVLSVSRQHANSSIRFRDILDILIQTSAVYGLTLLAEAIVGFIPENTHPAVWWAVDNYMDSLVYPIACIAPTVMVARVALLDSDNAHLPTIQNLTGLQFRDTVTGADETRSSLNGAIVVNEVGQAANIENKAA